MFAHDLMTREVESCTLDDTAKRAAEMMARKNCGFVPVVTDGCCRTLTGVLTDRDLALYLGTTGRRAEEVKVREFCTRDPHFAAVGTPIRDVEELMERFHLHRIPIVDENKKLVGVISLRDLAEEAWKDRHDLHPQVREKEIADIVEAISLAD